MTGSIYSYQAKWGIKYVMFAPNTPSLPHMFSMLIVLLLKPMAHAPDRPLTSSVWNVQTRRMDVYKVSMETPSPNVSCRNNTSILLDPKSLLSANFLSGLAKPYN